MKIAELVKAWRDMSPADWAENPYGWIMDTGEPIQLLPWQRAVLDAWWERRDVASTLAISNIKKSGKTLLDAILLCWRWLTLPGEHFAAGNDMDQASGRQFVEIARMVGRHSVLSEYVKVGRKRLELETTQSTLEALSLRNVTNGAEHEHALFQTHGRETHLHGELAAILAARGQPEVHTHGAYAGASRVLCTVLLVSCAESLRDHLLDRLIRSMGSAAGKRRFREIWEEAGEQRIQSYESEERLREALRSLDAVR